MAQVIKNNEILFLGSNGKLIRNEKLVQDVPSIFGTFDVQNFFDLKKALNESDFSYNQIKNLFFFKSGRWDIETISGVIIKLPPNNLKKKLELVVQILNEDKRKRINQIDLRQKDQIIIDER
jgi:cell division protein FtsQ